MPRPTDGGLQDRRVLIAEDDPTNRRMLCSLLSSWGYEPIGVETGDAAIEHLTSPQGPTIAIIDWMMPGATGPEVCRAARDTPRGKDLYLLLLTARGESRDIVTGLESGADDYVSKPFDFSELRARLKIGPRRRETSAAPTPEAIGPGFLVGGKWSLVERIGQGGMGDVWSARHTGMDLSAAIKLIHPELARSPMARTRFEQEARSVAQLRSRYVAHIFDYGITPGGIPYLVMELLRGKTLWDHLNERGPIAPNAASRLISEVARGLGEAHALGIVHRDVKPENVFLSELSEDSLSGSLHVAKLLDFGVAKRLDDNGPAMTSAGVAVGTLGYSSPEQLAGGPVGPATDVWSLGILAYTTVIGVPPLADTLEDGIFVRVCQGLLPRPTEADSSLPPEFDTWFARCCALDPADRFESTTEAARALRAIFDEPERLSLEFETPMIVKDSPQSSEPFVIRPNLKTPSTPERPRSIPWRSGLVAVSLLLLSLAALIAAFRTL